MSGMKIFWSWQSDTHQDSARYFVRGVLDALASDIGGLERPEEAERPDLESDGEDDALPAVSVDHDTLNVGGSPLIAETILRKIRECAVFVADVTPIVVTKSGKHVPNPNVMIELGYAMKVLDNERIVLVMNTAEGGDFRKLPFDLKHWRAPASFRLRRDADANTRAEVAAELQATLKVRIVPGLKKAERLMREDHRQAHREPRLAVTIEQEEAGPYRISQTPRNLGVPTLETVREATPVLPLSTAAPDPLDLRMRRTSLSSLTGLGREPPVSEWTAEEVQGYNRRVEAFYSDYEAFLTERMAWQRLTLRTFALEFVLENAGTAPATSIDVDLQFPDGVIIYDHDHELKPPTPPEPPAKRAVPIGVTIIRPQHRALDFNAFTRGIPRSTVIFPEEGRVQYCMSELKHRHQSSLDRIMVSFATSEDINAFEVAYVITAREPIDPIEGRVRFEVERSDADG